MTEFSSASRHDEGVQRPDQGEQAKADSDARHAAVQDRSEKTLARIEALLIEQRAQRSDPAHIERARLADEYIEESRRRNDHKTSQEPSVQDRVTRAVRNYVSGRINDFAGVMGEEIGTIEKELKTAIAKMLGDQEERLAKLGQRLDEIETRRD